VPIRFILPWLLAVGCAFAQESQPAPAPEPPAAEKVFVVEPGAKVLLSLLNSVSTRTAAEGDRVYLQTMFPILVDGRIVIPPGSYVAGTVTAVKRAGKVKGRAELFVRFDSLTLPNGVTRDFRARVGALDGSSNQDLDRAEGKIKGDTNKGGDATTVGTTAAYGAMIGAVAGRSGMGAGIGAAAGAAVGLAGVLMSRGPDATLERGSTVEMVLDRYLRFAQSELADASARGGPAPTPPARADDREGGGWPTMRRPLPRIP
jgi:type IV secretion system protein VirB10